MDNLQVKIKDSHKLIFSRDGMKSHELKILGLSILKLQESKDISKPSTISFSEYKKWTGLVGCNYGQFKKTALSILKTSVTIETKTDHWTAYNIFSDVEHFISDSGESLINVSFNPKMKKFLLPEIGEEIFTRVGYAYQCQLKGNYSVKLYRGFKTKYWHLEKKNMVAYLDIEIDDFRKWMGVKDDAYKEYRDLKRRIITPSCNEISEKTDISVTFDKQKNGLIRFLIRKNPNPKISTNYIAPVQIGFFDENDELKKIWNPEVLAKIYEKTTASLYASKDMVFVGEMASKHSIEVQKIDGRWEFKGILKEETPKKTIVSNVKQIGIVKDAIKKGYKAPENWSEGSNDSVYEEVGKAKEFLDNKRVNISKILEENEAKINAKIAEKTVSTEPKEEILEEKTPEIVTKKKKFLGIF